MLCFVTRLHHVCRPQQSGSDGGDSKPRNAVLSTPTSTATRPNTALYDPDYLMKARAAIVSGESWATASWAATRAEADQWVNIPSLSVMQKSVTPPSGTKHSYISLDKYYWPCNRPPPPLSVAPDTPDPTCSTGVRDNAICCLHECGVCGGKGCSDHPGGKAGCCLTNIKDSGRLCNKVGPPCVMNTSQPCNQSTGLPYTRHDGYTNPEMELYDHDRLINMSTAVIALSSAAYFGDDSKYGESAARLLRAWFLADDTKMEPNLDFGHFIPGVVNGSHGAVIDTHSWGELLDAVAILRAAPNSPWTDTDHTALQAWFCEYLNWLQTSDLGKGELASTNNHGVWYDNQVLAVALFVGDANSSKAAATRAPDRVTLEVEPNGTLPAELARTKAWSYSNFALDAFFHVATLRADIPASPSLWSYISQRGGSTRGALDWQIQFLGKGAKPWPYPQVEPFATNCTVSMVTQCIGSYYPILRRAAVVWADAHGNENSTYAAKATEVLDDAASSPYNLLLTSLEHI